MKEKNTRNVAIVKSSLTLAKFKLLVELLELFILSGFLVINQLTRVDQVRGLFVELGLLVLWVIDCRFVSILVGFNHLSYG